MADFKLTYNGRVVAFPGWNGHVAYNIDVTPYMIFQMDNTAQAPSKGASATSSIFYQYWENLGNGKWKYTRKPHVAMNLGDTRSGWASEFGFGQDTGTRENFITANCSIIEYGNFDRPEMQNFQIMFSGATIHDSILLEFPNAANVAGMFKDCGNMNSFASAQYNYFKDMIGIDMHTECFKGCGSATTAGLAELNVIPVGWGGLMVPPSTLMTTQNSANKNNANTYWWRLLTNYPSFGSLSGLLHIFTQASVTQYTGVSMNRSRIFSTKNSLATATGNTLYFYPVFLQASTISSSGISGITWIVAPSSPHGTLPAATASTDMAGTLDDSVYGPLNLSYGTYDSTKDTYFAFLVTNSPITNYVTSSIIDLSTMPYGFLYCRGGKLDAGLYWYTE